MEKFFAVQCVLPQLIIVMHSVDIPSFQCSPREIMSQ